MAVRSHMNVVRPCPEAMYLRRQNITPSLPIYSGVPTVQHTPRKNIGSSPRCFITGQSLLRQGKCCRSSHHIKMHMKKTDAPPQNTRPLSTPAPLITPSIPPRREGVSVAVRQASALGTLTRST